MDHRSEQIDGYRQDTTQDGRWRSGQRKPLCEPCADFTACRHPNRFDGLTQTGRHARPGLNKSRKSFRKDFPATVSGVTKELLHMHNELHTKACAWQIGHHTSRLAMATLGGTETEWTMRAGFRRNDPNHQQIISRSD